MQTIIETNHYLKRAEKLLQRHERDELVNFIAVNALRGDIIKGTGGVRKIRFAKEGAGKSGGVRVIYYYYDPYNPIYLFDIFSKNEKQNLKKAERNAFVQIVEAIKQEFRRKR